MVATFNDDACGDKVIRMCLECLGLDGANADGVKVTSPEYSEDGSMGHVGSAKEICELLLNEC
jgi:hypothetical protein